MNAGEASVLTLTIVWLLLFAVGVMFIMVARLMFGKYDTYAYISLVLGVVLLTLSIVTYFAQPISIGRLLV
ncbi:hypothetical protein B0H94_1126 [Salsuginibacillus halophilus]|uniref:Uncharacterized protein n=2 Tax=Salsuginibacillus halophilus TaxID=517424 RepID=A0A2P8H9K7_9BACI|nr:hypothetical protein B0H94_1126 [Salsuginibacillus halophilus]